MKFKCAGIIFILMLLFLGGCDSGYQTTEAREEIKQELGVWKGNTVKIANRNGNIKIDRNDKNILEINALKRSFYGKRELSKVKIEIKNDFGKIGITTKDLKDDVKVSVDYEIKIPEGVILEAIENSNGKIIVSNTEGDTEIINSNGDIVIAGARGVVSAKTSNAELNISGVRGVSRIETSNGNIRAEIMETSGDTLIKSTNGSIKLNMNQNINAQLEMITSNGDLFIHDIEIGIEQLTKSNLKGKLGNGGAKIYVETSNGDIDIFK